MMKNIFSRRNLFVISLCVFAAFAAGFTLPCLAAVYLGGYTTCDPLPEEYCTPIDEYIECDMDEVPVSKYDVIDAMRYFYDVTGVQPYMIITDTVNGSAQPSEDEIDAFLGENYTRLFDSDGGHLLTLAHISDSYDYMVRFYTVAGESTSMVFNQSVSIDKVFNSYFDGYYGEILLEDEVGSDGFKEVLTNILCDIFYGSDFEVMQTVEYEEYREPNDYSYTSYTSDNSELFTGVIVFLTIPVFIIIAVLSKKRQLEKEEAEEREARREMEYQINEKVRKEMAEQEKKRKNEPKKVKFPITCPGCGATAYPNNDGTCQYCGRWIV